MGSVSLGFEDVFAQGKVIEVYCNGIEMHGQSFHHRSPLIHNQIES